jgi:hypothetical protein
MYLQREMSRLEYSFKFGFLSDRIVESLSKYEKTTEKLSQNDKKVLSEGISFFEMVLKGKEQISTGIYESNALESLMTYNRSLSIVMDMPDLPKEISAKKIEEIFTEFKKSLQEIIEGEKVPLPEVRKTKTFFNCLREWTLSDSTTVLNGLYESRRSGRWESPLET